MRDRIPSSLDPARFKAATPNAAKPLPGETLREFRDRQTREDQLQRDRDRDRSRLSEGNGATRRIPVRYD